MVVAMLLTLACSVTAFADGTPKESRPPRKMTATRALLLFPINVVPDMLSNTLLFALNPLASLVRGQEPSNVWPLITVASPIMGPLSGLMDALGGYPFWKPVALDEHRNYAAPLEY